MNLEWRTPGGKTSKSGLVRTAPIRRVAIIEEVFDNLFKNSRR
jgi:hypothetical protein